MNRELENICKKLACKWSGEPVALLGKTGTGKTHLACACVNKYMHNKVIEWVENNKAHDFGWKEYAEESFLNHLRACKPLFVNESKIYSEVIDANKSGGSEGVLLKYSHTHFLVIDDLFASRQTEFARSVVYEILNERLSYNTLPTIITSNLLLREIGAIDDRIASRLQGEFTFEITESVDFRGV